MANAADEFSTMRAAWIAKGRPADPADPYWATVLASEAERLERNANPRFVEPLVIFGGAR